MVAVRLLGDTVRVEPFEHDLVDVGARGLCFNLRPDRPGGHGLAERAPKGDRGQGQGVLVARDEVELRLMPVEKVAQGVALVFGDPRWVVLALIVIGDDAPRAGEAVVADEGDELGIK